MCLLKTTLCEAGGKPHQLMSINEMPNVSNRLYNNNFSAVVISATGTQTCKTCLIFDIELVVGKLRCQGSLSGEFLGTITKRIKKGDVKVIDD